MAATELQAVASAVLRLAQQRGHIVPRDIRTELGRAGLDESRWKEVVELLRESLHYRQGRYHALHPAGSPRLEQAQQDRQRVQDAVEDVLRGQRSAADPSEGRQDERRQDQRQRFARPVRIETEDGETLTVMSQDLSPSGIRFIANRSLLGRKVHVCLPQAGGVEEVILAARILWTTFVAEGLFENGASFLETIKGSGDRS